MLSRRILGYWIGRSTSLESVCSLQIQSKRSLATNKNAPRGDGYTRFGHGREKPQHWMQVVWPSFAMLGLTASVIDWPWIWSCITPIFKADAATVVSTEIPAAKPNKVEVVEEAEEKPKPKQKRIGFRDKKVIEYENRIRMFSSPEKIFRYFATLKVVDSDSDVAISSSHVAGIYMTPEDFVRAITPGIKQPEGLGLDKFRQIDRKKLRSLKVDMAEDTIFNKIGAHGLLSFTDFIFLLTVLSTSPRHFAIAFQMFDLNGDGELDFTEFQQVESIIRRQTTINAKANGGSSSKSHQQQLKNHQSSEDSGLANYFFGADRKKKLPYQDFLDFQEQLQRDILFIEFERRLPDEEGKISESAFAEMLLMHSGLSEVKVTKMLKRVKKLCKENPEMCPGCKFDEIDKFFVFINNITDVDTALTFYQMAGASIDPGVIQHVAKTVAFVEIPDNIIREIFAIFDENQDGELSSKEFVNVMKRRLMRGLERSKDTGIVKLLDAAWKCAQEKTPAHHN